MDVADNNCYRMSDTERDVVKKALWSVVDDGVVHFTDDELNTLEHVVIGLNRSALTA